MPELSYSITELEKITGLSRRTIHYYIAEGLISSPEGLGSTAKYSEVHVLRLKLIRLLQKTHLKLSGIKEFLDSMSFDEMRKYLARAEAESLSISGPRNFSASPRLSDISKSRLELSAAGPYNDADSEEEPDLLASYMQTIPYLPQKQNLPWWRHEITDGIEVNVRSDIFRKFEKKINDFIQKLRDELRKEDK